jgi:hypothetical protein
MGDGDKPFFTYVSCTEYAFLGRRQGRLDWASIGREHAFKRPLVVRTGSGSLIGRA